MWRLPKLVVPFAVIGVSYRIFLDAGGAWRRSVGWDAHTHLESGDCSWKKRSAKISLECIGAIAITGSNIPGVTVEGLVSRCRRVESSAVIQLESLSEVWCPGFVPCHVTKSHVHCHHANRIWIYASGLNYLDLVVLLQGFDEGMDHFCRLGLLRNHSMECEM